MATGIAWFMLLLLSNPLAALLSHPPRDFASLFDPRTALQKMDVKTDEGALLDLLKSKADPAANGDDLLYVKNLLAIRLFEQTKSPAALPVLGEIAQGADITLADAAREALATINGRPGTRPSGALILKQLAGALPADAGFVLVADIERDAGRVTLHSFLEAAFQEMERRGYFAPPEGAAATPEQNAQMQASRRESLARMEAQVEYPLIQALSRMGNLRLDAVVAVLSTETGAGTGGYRVWILKGLYDPERLTRLVKGAFQAEREIAGHKVLGGPGDRAALCFFDAQTIVFVRDRSPGASGMAKVLEALTAEPRAPSAEVAKAFDQVTERKMRVAFSGALAPAQQERLRAVIEAQLPVKDENAPADALQPLRTAGRGLLLQLAAAESYSATLDTQGRFQLDTVCADPAAAAMLADSFGALRQLLQEALTRQSTVAPPAMRPLFDRLGSAGPLWQTVLADRAVTVQVNNLMPLFLLMRFGMRSVPAIPAPQPGK